MVAFAHPRVSITDPQKKKNAQNRPNKAPMLYTFFAHLYRYKRPTWIRRLVCLGRKVTSRTITYFQNNLCRNSLKIKLKQILFLFYIIWFFFLCGRLRCASWMPSVVRTIGTTCMYILCGRLRSASWMPSVVRTIGKACMYIYVVGYVVQVECLEW